MKNSALRDHTVDTAPATGGFCQVTKTKILAIGSIVQTQVFQPIAIPNFNPTMTEKPWRESGF